jgi:hypothetical protein
MYILTKVDKNPSRNLGARCQRWETSVPSTRITSTIGVRYQRQETSIHRYYVKSIVKRREMSTPGSFNNEMRDSFL